MASKRTTLYLGSGERRAAKALAARWGVTQSEAIRRALLKVEAEEAGPDMAKRIRERVANLPGLFRAFRMSRKQIEAELERIDEERDNW